MILREDYKYRDFVSSQNSISKPKILETFCDVPDNKVAICNIIWLSLDSIYSDLYSLELPYIEM